MGSKDVDVELELEVEVIATTDAALLCDIDGDEHWIPRKLISEDSDVTDMATVGDAGMVVIPEWFAIKERIV